MQSMSGSHAGPRLPRADSASVGSEAQSVPRSLGSPQRMPPHPGEFLESRFLKPLGLNQAQFAQRLRVSRRGVNELLRGRGRSRWIPPCVSRDSSATTPSSGCSFSSPGISTPRARNCACHRRRAERRCGAAPDSGTVSRPRIPPGCAYPRTLMKIKSRSYTGA